MKINCNNLKAEMDRKEVSGKDIAELLNLSYTAIHKRLNGTSQWLYKECVAVHEKFFPELELTFLFKIENSNNQTLVR